MFIFVGFFVMNIMVNDGSIYSDFYFEYDEFIFILKFLNV